MKILLITTAFNGLSQRVWVELDKLDHKVKLHLASAEQNMEEAVDQFQPDLIIAPYLKTVIPEIIWKQFICLIVHPGIVGDRGSSSLDWAILNNEKEWGVTILQATAKMDAGPVWATRTFPVRNISKSFLYRHEVTEAAISALLEAIQKIESKSFIPQSFSEVNGYSIGRWNRSTNENDFKFSWDTETDSLLRKINAADSTPGALCEISGTEYFCYGGSEEDELKGQPGQILAKRDDAICVATKDAAVWIRCLKKHEAGAIKLPAAIAMDVLANNIPLSFRPLFEVESGSTTFREIRYREEGEVGFLHFDFYNGAMGTDQCRRLHSAFLEAKERKTKVIVLMGGEDIWCNGIHLNMIEAAPDPAQASWENINALDDLIQEIICTESHYIISALQGNAGAGGVPLALAADKVVAKSGIVFNPHTRNMGLYGSEYWTYLLPRRIGTEKSLLFTEECLPWGTSIATEVKLIDVCVGPNENFVEKVKAIAEDIAGLSWFPKLLASKKFKRQRDESYKPLQKYRDDELEKMHKNFFDDDLNYDSRRYCFVHKIKSGENVNSITGKDLFSQRRKIWRRRKYDKLFYET
ncbi:MAG: enoyl-CoA hydratase-related protein [Ginsengibacter sp.]